MDSRTKFYGSVLAMLALSSVAIRGFPASHRPMQETEDSSPAEEVLPTSGETLATSYPAQSRSPEEDATTPSVTPASEPTAETP